MLSQVFSGRQKLSRIFKDSMSTPAVGSLSKRKRFSGELYAGRIYAKTGHISGVNTLSGYCKTSAGKWLAFAVMTGSPAAGNALVDEIVKEMINIWLFVI